MLSSRWTLRGTLLTVLGLALVGCTRFKSVLPSFGGAIDQNSVSGAAPGASPVVGTPVVTTPVVSTPVVTTPVVTTPVMPAPTPSPVSTPVTSGLDVSHADIDLTGYSLLFNDEFNAVSVATASPKGSKTWYYIPPYGSAGYYSQSIWDASAFSVISGILQNVVSMDSAGKYHTGNISSVDETGTGFSTKYGYFEARAKMPDSGNGSWPAFWLGSTAGIPGLSPAGTNVEEIDIFEWYGIARDNNEAMVQQASHNWKGDNSGGDETAPFLYKPGTPMPGGAKPWQDFHVYGVRVDPVHITWYIDGVQSNQISTPTAYMAGKFYMMFDYALGGGWPLSGVVKGSSFQVDWVRVYDLPK